MRNTLVLSGIIVSIFCLKAHARLIIENPICTDLSCQDLPAASGNIVVWVDSRNGNSDIYAYNLSTQTEFPICTQIGNQYAPAVSGNIVVWQDNRNGSYDIYGYDLITETEFSVCILGNNQSEPAISGNIVVWQDYRNGNDDIYGYDFSTQTEFPICTNSISQYSPAINGNFVVWRQGSADIYGYNLSTHTEFPVCTRSRYQTDPRISGDIVVWEDERNYNDDIYGYNLSTHTEFPICTEGNNQYHPAISGNIVVWQDSRNGSWDIYGYDLSTQTEFPICVDGNTQEAVAISDNFVVWRDSRNPEHCNDIYGAFVGWRLSPDSDTCENAPYVVEDESFYGTTYYATGTDISSCAYNDVYDAWNRYTPSQSGTVTIATDGSTFDTVLSVYEGCGGAELACNDDYCLDNPQSQIVMDVVKGKTYYIRVAGFNVEVGDYDLLVTHGDCSNRPQSDIDGNCKVDLLDFVIMASEWLSCGYSNPGDC